MNAIPQQTTNLGSSQITGYLRLPQVLELIPVSRAGWWAGVKSGHFPRPVKLSTNTTAWRVDDIRALIARINAQSSEKNSKAVA